MQRNDMIIHTCPLGRRASIAIPRCNTASSSQKGHHYHDVTGITALSLALPGLDATSHPDLCVVPCSSKNSKCLQRQLDARERRVTSPDTLEDSPRWRPHAARVEGCRWHQSVAGPAGHCAVGSTWVRLLPVLYDVFEVLPPDRCQKGTPIFSFRREVVVVPPLLGRRLWAATIPSADGTTALLRTPGGDVQCYST
jgi:hypothetical protein